MPPCIQYIVQLSYKSVKSCYGKFDFIISHLSESSAKLHISHSVESSATLQVTIHCREIKSLYRKLSYILINEKGLVSWANVMANQVDMA